MSGFFVKRTQTWALDYQAEVFSFLATNSPIFSLFLFIQHFLGSAEQKNSCKNSHIYDSGKYILSAVLESAESNFGAVKDSAEYPLTALNKLKKI